MRHVLFLLSSGRRNGNSERLARQTVQSGMAADWVDLTALALPPFSDTRPNSPQVDPVLAALLERMYRADDIVFVAPVYWYALPAPAKLFIDHWSGFLDQPDLRFRDRISGRRVWLITARADPNPSVPLAAESMLRQSAEWLGMIWGGALHGVGDAPGDVEVHPTWEKAQEFLTLR